MMETLYEALACYSEPTQNTSLAQVFAKTPQFMGGMQLIWAENI
jgi:hypothetical protein